MKKKLSSIISILLFFLALLTPIKVFALNLEENFITLDVADENTLPRNFRKTSDLSILENSNYNLKGLSNLNISGSGEFSKLQLKNLINDINKDNIKIVDLRQESHGFVNGDAISWIGINNKANKGLSLDEVLLKEVTQLASIKLNSPLITDNGKKTLFPKLVLTESVLVKEFKKDYFRITVTDGEIPTEDMVDRFIDFVKTVPKDTWLHFHCKEGIGRTTMFMCIYDMMKNSKEVSFNDIKNRQLALANLPLSFFDKDNSKITFLEDFYNYTKSNNDNYNTSWKEFLNREVK